MHHLQRDSHGHPSQPPYCSQLYAIVIPLANSSKYNSQATFVIPFLPNPYFYHYFEGLYPSHYSSFGVFFCTILNYRFRYSPKARYTKIITKAAFERYAFGVNKLRQPLVSAIYLLLLVGLFIVRTCYARQKTKFLLHLQNILTRNPW